MKFKISFLLPVFLMIFLPLKARDKDNPATGIRPGVQGGLNIHTHTGSDYWGEALNNKALAGYGAGVNIIIPVLPDIYLMPGLQVVKKGARQNIIMDNIVKTVHLFYIAVPVNILYRPQAGNGHLLLGAGPYAAFGIGGKDKIKSGSGTTELRVKFLSDASEEPTTYVYYKLFDGGLDLLLGYEFFSNISLCLNTQIGITKINSEYNLPNDKTSRKNLGLGIMAGYRF